MDAVFITARLKSTRLKRKVLMKVDGIELINYQINRLKARINKKIILTTSINIDDDPLAGIADKAGIDCFRGSEEDVLDRYLQACKFYSISRFYIVYGDEPFVDIDCLLKNFDIMSLGSKTIVLNDKLPVGTFGYGLTFEAVEYMVKEKKSCETEVWGGMLSELNLLNVVDNSKLLGSVYSDVRLTVDYSEDFRVFENLIALIGSDYYRMTTDEIVEVYRENSFHKINGMRIDEYNRRIEVQRGAHL